MAKERAGASAMGGALWVQTYIASGKPDWSARGWASAFATQNELYYREEREALRE